MKFNFVQTFFFLEKMCKYYQVISLLGLIYQISQVVCQIVNAQDTQRNFVNPIYSDYNVDAPQDSFSYYTPPSSYYQYPYQFYQRNNYPEFFNTNPPGKLNTRLRNFQIKSPTKPIPPDFVRTVTPNFLKTLFTGRNDDLKEENEKSDVESEKT